MKYGNFYDLESLTLLNRHEGCACSIKECDVEKVNRLISRMREDRERVGLPTAGDVVTYITRGGDYYPQAHIERGDDREVHICLLPQTPFCHENEKCTGYNTEGGPWVTTGPKLLIPDGIRSKQSGCGGIPEGTGTVPSSSTHSSGHGNTRNPILCTESTPQKNGRDTSSSVSRILNRLMPLSIGMRHSPFTRGKNWNGWSGFCTESFSTDSVPVCSYSGHTVWNGRNFPHGNGTC